MEDFKVKKLINVKFILKFYPLRAELIRSQTIEGALKKIKCRKNLRQFYFIILKKSKNYE